MIFEIVSKDANGNIVFSGRANKVEAEFILNVGVNYLLIQGAVPMLTGKEELESEDNAAMVAPGTSTQQ